MKIAPSALAVLVVLVGFFAAAAFYYRSQSSPTKNTNGNASSSFDAKLPPITASAQGKIVDKHTKSAEPRGRLSYPANVYNVRPLEGLFTIGKLFQMDYQIIKLANGISNENSIQAGTALAIPKLSSESDYYRLEFKINEDRASELNRLAGLGEAADYLDPLKVAKKDGLTYFAIAADNSFDLGEQDLSQGTATVKVASPTHKQLIGLIQPKTKGSGGIWAVYYIEDRD